MAKLCPRREILFTTSTCNFRSVFRSNTTICYCSLIPFLSSCCYHPTTLLDSFLLCVSLLSVRSLKDSQEGVAPKETLAFLQEKFSREFIELYRRLAESAGQQMNYAVAYKYLQLSECAIAEVREILRLQLHTSKFKAKVNTVFSCFHYLSIYLIKRDPKTNKSELLSA